MIAANNTTTTLRRTCDQDKELVTHWDWLGPHFAAVCAPRRAVPRCFDHCGLEVGCDHPVSPFRMPAWSGPTPRHPTRGKHRWCPPQTIPRCDAEAWLPQPWLFDCKSRYDSVANNNVGLEKQNQKVGSGGEGALLTQECNGGAVLWQVLWQWCGSSQ